MASNQAPALVGGSVVHIRSDRRCCSALPRVATAATGGAPTPPAAAPAASGSPTGTPAGEAPSAGALSLVSAQTTPRKSFFFGVRYPNAALLDRQQPGSRTTFASTWSTQPAKSCAASTATTSNRIRKCGSAGTARPATGRPARNGRYSFRIEPQGGPEAAAPRRRTSSDPLSLGFALYGYAFPIARPARLRRCGAGRFGAAALGPYPPGPGRDGRLRHSRWSPPAAAPSSTPATRAPPATTSSSTARAPASISSTCTWPNRSPLKTGDPVRTGQPIGIVGDTGDATACHLHFEIWTAPGWYEGGSPIDPLPYLEEVGPLQLADR